MAKKKTLPAAKEAATGPAPAHKDCPATRAIELVAHKWTMHILFTLRQAGQPIRFRRLQQLIEPITQKRITLGSQASTQLFDHRPGFHARLPRLKFRDVLVDDDFRARYFRLPCPLAAVPSRLPGSAAGPWPA